MISHGPRDAQRVAFSRAQKAGARIGAPWAGRAAQGGRLHDGPAELALCL